MKGGNDEILNRFINISMPIGRLDRDKGIVEYPTGARIGDFCAQGFVTVEEWTEERHRSFSDRQLGDFLSGSLLSKTAYFLVHLDEYFLPGSSSYIRKKHFRHGVLLFDATQGRAHVSVAAYLADGSYGAVQMSVPDLVSAMRSPFDRTLAYKSKDMVKQIVPVNRLAAGGIDLKRIKRQVMEFINSRPDIEDIHSSDIARYGVGTYRILSDYISRCLATGGGVDPRYTRFYAERIALMTKRIARMMADLKDPDLGHIKESISRAEQILRSIHYECYFYTRRPKFMRTIFRDKALQVRVSRAIEEAADRELYALSDLVDVL